MIKRIILMQNQTYFLHQCQCGKEWMELNSFKASKKEHEHKSNN